MRRHCVVVLVGLTLLIGLVMYFQSNSRFFTRVAQPKPTTIPQSDILTSSNSPVVDQALQRAPRNPGTRSPLDEFARAFAMPISYWGRVVDENGGPLSAPMLRGRLTTTLIPMARAPEARLLLMPTACSSLVLME
jgi:hypothetical protein